MQAPYPHVILTNQIFGSKWHSVSAGKSATLSELDTVCKTIQPNLKL